MAITAKFEADFTQFTQAVANAEGSLKSLETGAKTLGPAILASLASTELRRFATDVKDVAVQFIGAFAEEEAAVKRLEAALAAQGTTAALAQYTALAAQFQQTTIYSDDLILSMEGLLVQIGGVLPAQMNAALKASTDLAAGLQIDLRTATMLVGKAFAGETGTLARYGIVIDEAKFKTQGATVVIDAIAAKMGGQATAAAATLTGSVAILGNQMDDFKGKVGETLNTALTPLLQAFMSLPQGMQTTVIAVVAIGTALAPLAITVAALVPVMTGLAAAIGGTAGLAGAFAIIRPFLGPAGIIAAGFLAWIQVFQNLDVYIWAAKASWDMLKNTFATAATAITDSARMVYEGVKGWLVDRFESIVANIKGKIDAVTGAFKAMYETVVGHSIIPDMVDGIGAEMGKLEAVMVAPASAAASGVVGAMAGAAKAVTAAFLTGEGIPSVGNTVLPGGSLAASDWGGNIGVPMSGVGVLSSNIGRPSTLGAISITNQMSGMLLTTDPAARQQLMNAVSTAVTNSLKISGALR